MKFISFRRYYLDKMLSDTVFLGKVLDVGGKKNNPRGSFRPPIEGVESWEYLNIDSSTGPDYFAFAEDIPVRSNYFDMVVMTEVIEHLDNPETVLRECFRVLRDNGRLIISAPFLYPIHADPYDFQRWTPEKIKKEFQAIGFKIDKMIPMGGIIAVTLDMVNIYLDALRLGFFVKSIKRLLALLAPLALFLDAKVRLKETITTGFFIAARKAH